jgi:drug/metabolite transporter (DMT)-like permease
MVAILGGLGAAVAFAVTILTASRATRMIGAPSVLAWVLLTGFCIVVPWALLEGRPEGLDGRSVVFLVLSGVGNVLGLLLVYSALRLGKVGIVAPITSTEGAIAAVIAVLAGEHVAEGSGIVLAGIAVGIVLAAVAGNGDGDGDGDAAHRWTTWRVPVFAIGAACAFGISIYATGRASAELPVAWAVSPPRLLGVLVVALPLALTSRLVLTRAALPLVVASGIAEVLGFASFAVGARHGLAVAAVLASQFAAIAAVVAYILFHERLGRVQLLGVTTIVIGVAVLTWLQA